MSAEAEDVSAAVADCARQGAAVARPAAAANSSTLERRMILEVMILPAKGPKP